MGIEQELGNSKYLIKTQSSSYTIKVNDSNELYFLNTKLIAIKNNIETALFNSNFSREYKDFITEILGSVLDNKLTIDNTIINNFVNQIISETIEELN
jgi:membrane-associated HD superfamily phosphohydrolase